MRNAFLAGASAFAIVLGGCSMFQSSDAQTPKPVYSGSSQAPSQVQSQAPQPATDQAGSDQPAATHAKHASRMNPDEVKQAQQKLKDDGDYMGNVDGKFGAKTAQAVKEYQKKNSLKQTGRLDRDTRAKLMGTTGSGSSAAPAATPNAGTSSPPANSAPTTPPKSAPATTPNGSL